MRLPVRPRADLAATSTPGATCQSYCEGDRCLYGRVHYLHEALAQPALPTHSTESCPASRIRSAPCRARAGHATAVPRRDDVLTVVPAVTTSAAYERDPPPAASSDARWIHQLGWHVHRASPKPRGVRCDRPHSIYYGPARQHRRRSGGRRGPMPASLCRHVDRLRSCPRSSRGAQRPGAGSGRSPSWASGLLVTAAEWLNAGGGAELRPPIVVCIG